MDPIQEQHYLPLFARLNTIASAPNLIVLVLKPLPSAQSETNMIAKTYKNDKKNYMV